MDNKQELSHHGVKGQKWGVRRYQPYDDEYRPNKQFDKIDKSANIQEPRTNKTSGLFDPTINKGKGKPKTSPAEELARNTQNTLRGTSEVLSDINRMKSKKQTTSPEVKKKISNMTDQELRAAINRMEMEKRYSSLMATPERETGLEKANEILDTAGKVAGVAGSIIGTIALVQKLRGQ